MTLFKNKTFLVNNFAIILFMFMLVYFNASLNPRLVDGFMIVIAGFVALGYNYWYCYYKKK